MALPDRPRPTGADVARLAGVAQSSVSRVFANKAVGRISPDVERRIREAAATLGYEPIASGRALRSGTSSSIGLVVTDFGNPFFGSLSRGAQQAARERGMSIVLMEAEVDERGFLPYRASDGGLVDGLLLFGIDPPAGANPAAVALVETESPGFRSVVFDSDGAMRLAVDHLVALGHRRIAYLGIGNGRWTFERRRAGWVTAMLAHRLEAAAELIVETDLGLEAAAAAAGTLLDGPSPPTAIVCADDILAAAVYRAVERRGLAVGAGISVIGFGGTIVAQTLWPALTTVTASARELGAQAVRLLLDGEAAQQRSVSTTLDERDSVADLRRTPG